MVHDAATHAISGRRFEFAFSVGSTIFWVGILVWVGPALGLPHIYGKPNNLFGIGLLVVIAIVMLIVSVFFTYRLAFEIRGATLRDAECVVRYRYLGERVLPLPYGGRLKHRVRLPDLKSERGFRESILVYRSVVERVVIPIEMGGAQEIALALTDDSPRLRESGSPRTSAP